MGKVLFIASPRIILGLVTGLLILMVFLLFGIILLTAAPVFQISGLGFFTGTTWDYQTHTYGVLNFIVGTIILTVLSLIMAAPLGILTAIFISEWAPKTLGKGMGTMVELLVGIPSIVYGLFGFWILSPFFRDIVNPSINAVLGFIPIFHLNNQNSESSFFLASVILMIMILPTIMALSLDALRSVPDETGGGIVCSRCRQMGDDSARHSSRCFCRDYHIAYSRDHAGDGRDDGCANGPWPEFAFSRINF